MIKKFKEIYVKYNEKYNLDKYIPIFLYLFFGVVTTIINIVVYALMARLLNINYIISNLVAWFSSVTVAYITNKLYVFKSDTSSTKSAVYEVFKFLAVRVFSLLLDMAIMYIGINIIKIDDVIMKCISNVIVIITNYFMSRYIVFTGKNEKKTKKYNKDDEDENIKKINLSFLILLIIATSIFLADILIYITNLKYIISNIIAFFVVVTSVILFVKLKKINIKNEFCMWDIIFFIFLSVLCISTIVFPDSFWDTRSYHIYLGQNPFADKINEDFFAGRTLNSFLFPLADRIHYLFRYILGYRLGTIMSYYVLFVLFYQVKKIIKSLTNIKEKYLSILAILPIILFSILEQVGTYYIDNFSLCFLLELVYIVFFEKNILRNRVKVYCIGLVIGIIIAIKVSNAAFLIPLFIYFLIKNIKDIKYLKIYDYIITILFIFMPFIIYAIDNFIQTGNIVYPYYNSIFKSEYFDLISWSDTRFGGKTIIEKLLWPFYALIEPKRLYDYESIDFMWYAGYLTICVYLVINLIFAIIKIVKNLKIKKENKEIKILDFKENIYVTFSLNILLMYIIWSFLLGGYVRYATIIPVCTYILIICLLTKSIDIKNIILSIVLSCFIGASLCLTYVNFCKYKQSVITIGIYSNFDNMINVFKSNASNMLNDKNELKIPIEEGAVWGVIADDSDIPTLVRENENVPIYHLRGDFYKDSWYGTNDKLSNLYDEKTKNVNAYIALNSSSILSKIEALNYYGFLINNLMLYDKKLDNLDQNEVLYVARVKYTNSNSKNIIGKITNSNSYTIIKEENDVRNKLNIHIAFDNNFAKSKEEIGKVKLYGINAQNEKVLINELIVKAYELSNIKVDFNLYNTIIIESDENSEYLMIAY